MANKLKVLLINDYKEIIGGAERIVITIYKNLKKHKNINVKLITSDNNMLKGYEIPWIPNKLNPLYYFNIVTYLQLKKIIKDYKPNVIHYHNILYKLSPSVLFCGKNVKKIITLHDYEIINFNYEIKKLKSPMQFKNNIVSNLLNFCRYRLFILGAKGAQYISPSIFMKKIYSSYLKENIYVLNNPIKYKKRNRYIFAGNILYIGRLVREKGLENLIKAYTLSIKTIKKRKLLIIGEGKDGKYLRKINETLGNKKKIIFLGKIKDPSRYLKQSSLVIVPSIYQDNFPTVCLEAISYGVPVIASRVGGIPEIIKDNYNGYLFNAGNYKELAKKINLFYSKKKGYTMSKNAHISSKKYESEKNIKRLIEIYKNE